MSVMIKKASKKSKKLRILLSASSGSGKTYSSLLLAYGITKDWSKICVIDSERESSSLYADLGEYSILPLDEGRGDKAIMEVYHPQKYIDAIKAAENAGFEVIIIDSTTHEWQACLELHARLGATFADWGKITPLHNKFIDAIMGSKAHIIATVRRKEEYAITTGSNGKTTVEKKGLGEVQKDGFTYEYDLVFEIENNNHLARQTKDRTGVFVGKGDFLITEETGAELTAWANGTGRTLLDDVLDLIRACDTIEKLKAIHETYVDLHSNTDYLAAKEAKKEELKVKK